MQRGIPAMAWSGKNTDDDDDDDDDYYYYTSPATAPLVMMEVSSLHLLIKCIMHSSTELQLRAVTNRFTSWMKLFSCGKLWHLCLSTFLRSIKTSDHCSCVHAQNMRVAL